jgi:hypothetical protein
MNKNVFLLSCLILFAYGYNNIYASGYNFDEIANSCDVLPYNTHFYKKVYSQYVNNYNKTYNKFEYLSRFETFFRNVHLIKSHNEKNLNYKYGINHFTDLEYNYFKQTFQPYTPYKKYFDVRHEYNNYRFDQTLDWRTENNPSSVVAVSSVKNQGQCGSCWAFSSSGATEGAWAVSTNQLYNLSAQELVDCSTQNSGCDGGDTDLAFDFIKTNGLCTEESYQYTGVEGACKECELVAKIAGYTDVNPGNETGLMAQLEFGPVSVAIEADQQAFQLYSSGVFDGDCGTNLDHAVLLVGYGTDETSGLDYWVVKNSWGWTWGENGYIRLVRGKNMCGIALSASRPYYLNVGN